MASLSIFALLASVEVLAQNSGAIEDIVKGSDWQKRDQPAFATIDATLAERLDEIDRLVDEEKFDEALVELDGVLRRRLTDYAEAVILQMTGYVHARLDDSDRAIEYWEKTLVTGALTQGQHQGVLYSLANQYAARLEFATAIDRMTEWFQYEESPFADAYTFTGTCFAALEQYEAALPFLERAIELSDRPVESWYRMVVSLQLELALYEEAIPYLKAMVERWTQVPEYWEQLAGVYLELNDDRAALDTTMIAYINGMVTTPERILGLVEMNLAHGIPLIAGEILENQLSAGVLAETRANLDILIRIWISAREYDRAILAIDRMAEISEAGEYYMQAARLYVQAGNWGGAVSSARKALEAGYEDRVGATMMIGNALSEQGLYAQSRDAFDNVLAIGTDEEKENARQWIEFVEESLAFQRRVPASQ